ncbi:MAG: helix-turn-helix domain-containing protein [Oscillospiraceae bacterium]|nr:helix-turn-helix domain-containing protein [Oscillospiraceae bacterium]
MTFYDRYCELCRGRNMKPHSRATTDLLGISNGSVTVWKNGTLPKAETLDRLSRFFGVTVDYLICGSDKDEIPLDSEMQEFLQLMASRSEMRTLFRASKNATKEDIEIASNLIDSLVNRSRK